MNLEEIREQIAKEPDVAEVLGLEADKMNVGRFLYFIRTPFQTFPRFVIGITSKDPDECPVLLSRCTNEDNARRQWALIQEGNR